MGILQNEEVFSMLVSFARAAILYLVVVAFMRMMGKRQISQMQPFELVITILVADLVNTPIGDVSVPIIEGIIPLFALLVMHHIIDFLCMKSMKIRRLVCGKPSVIIENGVLDQMELNRLSINMSDLMENLRSQKVLNISDVMYCVIETNGEISVILKGAAAPASARNAKIKVDDPEMSYTIIYNGKPDKENLKQLGVSQDLLEKNLSILGVPAMDRAYVAMMNGKDQIFVQTDKEKKTYLGTLKREGVA